MKIQRAQLIAGILLSFVIVALVYAPAFAQQWPAKPLRIIVPFPPGQGADIVGRLVAERLTVVLGQQVIVENRPGAGSMLGTEYAAKAPGDGYTLLIGAPARSSSTRICTTSSGTTRRATSRRSPIWRRCRW